MKSKLFGHVSCRWRVARWFGNGRGQDEAESSAYRCGNYQERSARVTELPLYGVFDDLSFQVRSGQVTLYGEVTQPMKKSNVHNIVAKLPGVESVNNNIQVLPLSNNDTTCCDARSPRRFTGTPRFPAMEWERTLRSTLRR